MNEMKVTASHLRRTAVIYVRQSTLVPALPRPGTASFRPTGHSRKAWPGSSAPPPAARSAARSADST